MVRYECIDFFLLIVYGEVRMYRLSFVNKDDDDDEALSKKFFTFLIFSPQYMLNVNLEHLVPRLAERISTTKKSRIIF